MEQRNTFWKILTELLADAFELIYFFYFFHIFLWPELLFTVDWKFFNQLYSLYLFFYSLCVIVDRCYKNGTKIYEIKRFHCCYDKQIRFRPHYYFINPFMPTGAFNICCPRDCVSRHNGGTSGAPLKPLRVESALRAL